ncbi:hypothetical protein V474_11795 [Novosphingobium barchaimii LL02]|uniref:Uncharacterized protein n=1 Tax=Novosphingobium barchaimii LL02 TaxID=1114963 RepID=A0A0J7Y9Q3_9SPHN|nr:hypothetical protein [Novosphingobium barchaimii]KMS60043.1 hypothetical protein V474_11795 [Novosphingobium barchaimii LL02]
MNTAATAIDIARRHVEAVSKLLLGNKKIDSRLSIVAADPLTATTATNIALMAKEADADIICLEFDFTVTEPELLCITLVAARDEGVYIHSGCRLSMAPGSRLARLLPREGGRGHFQILPNEIVQRDSKPAGLLNGIDRAASRLRELVRSGVDVTDQVSVHLVAAE